WGCPIPVIHCPRCGVVPVPDQDLPVALPEDVTFDEPGNALDHHPTWKHVTCPQCGAKALRETDTMDTFVDSSWYFARFTDPWNEAAPTTRAVADRMMPVDPDDIIGEYGADIARWFMLSDSPPDRDVIWSEEGVQGSWRFAQKDWRLVREALEISQAATAAPAQSDAAAVLALRKAAHGAL